MKRPLKPEERQIWGMVAATVHPLPGKATPSVEVSDALTAPGTPQGAARIAAPSAPTPKPARPRPSLDNIEPRRKHRIARERDPIGARLDLHGLDQDRARGVLERFLTRAWDEGFRAVLVITGKGVRGDGVLKRRTPEWLAAPHLAHMVAGISDAARHHGGEGALYVALKRKERG
ncbi:Smr/MutS family protein [Phenylobacterium sp.]|uniref:Smr/MutS family protein n=1 Tax=Phenylobacterium sp. TaxID=1871053 RepID=UPI00286B2F5B|nr:Smr/MutS family protein [Phenylobacterium sp.]